MPITVIRAIKTFLGGRKASREKRWVDAERLWAIYVDLFPRDIRGWLNYGSALLALGKASDVQRCAKHIQKQWPRRVESAIFGARALSLSANPDDRIVAWRAVVERFPFNPVVYSELGHALVDGGNGEEAECIATILEKHDQRQGLRLKGQIRNTLKPYDDHTQFWLGVVHQFPGERELQQHLIHAALRSGQSAVAAREFWTLIDSRDVRLADVNFAIGLSNLFCAEADPTNAAKVTRAFLKAMRSNVDYRLAALKLSRLIFKNFPRNPVEPSTIQPRFEKMIAQAPAECGPKKWLMDACKLYKEIALASPESLLDTDVSLAQCQSFISEVNRYLSNGLGFSLIRLGDGESSALGYEPSAQSFFDEDASERECIWWGRSLSSEVRSRINSEVSRAIWDCDALGIPCGGRILRDLRLRGNEPVSASRSGRGLRAVVYAVEQRLLHHANDLPLFVSSHLHQDLYRHDLYAELFRGKCDILCVSSHNNLPEILQSRFGVISAQNIPIKSAFYLREKFASAESPYILPDDIGAVIDALDKDLSGRLVIVAAGYLGKWICYEVKQRNGVALDLGSIPDYWLGVRSRGYLDVA